MNKVFLATRNFLSDEEGVTIIEYALIAALIALGVVATVVLVRDQLNTLFTRIKNCLASPSGATCS